MCVAIFLGYVYSQVKIGKIIVRLKYNSSLPYKTIDSSEGNLKYLMILTFLLDMETKWQLFIQSNEDTGLERSGVVCLDLC